MQLYPAVDLRDGKVVRLIQGDYDRQLDFDVAPADAARGMIEGGAAWIHVVDLDAARSGVVTNAKAVGEILAAGDVRVQVGGGVRSTAVVDDWLTAGVARVIVGTAATKDWDWFVNLATSPGYGGKLVLGLDARDGKVAVDGWTVDSGIDAVELASRTRGLPLGGLVYTNIATDGMLTGPDVAGLSAIAAATDVPVIASGGVGSLDDLRALKPLPIDGVIVGRALYDGRFTVAEAVEVLTP